MTTPDLQPKEAHMKELRELLTQALDLLPDDAPAPVTTFDFGNGLVPAHRHTNPDGSEGGRASDTHQLTATGNELVLGQKYRDIIHGKEGTATARYSYLMGCDRINLEYLDKDGKIESSTFDVMQLEEVPAPVIEGRASRTWRSTGGPERSTPPSVDPRP